MLCALEPAIEKMRASIGLTAGVVEFMPRDDKATDGRADLTGLMSVTVSANSRIRGTAHHRETPLDDPVTDICRRKT